MKSELEEQRKPTIRFQGQPAVSAGPSTNQYRNQTWGNSMDFRNKPTPNLCNQPTEMSRQNSVSEDPHKCRYCKQEGHGLAECPIRNRRQGGMATNSQSKRETTTSLEFNQTGRANRSSNLDSKKFPDRAVMLASPTKGRREAYLEIQLRTRRMLALLDTGCDHSVIGRRLIPQLTLKPTTQKLYAANGNELSLLGETTVHFKVGEIRLSAAVVVTEALDELILGMDWLTENNCTWDFGRKSFEVSGQSGIFKDRNCKASVRKLYCDSTIVVPARHQMDIRAWATMPSLSISGVWAVKPTTVDQELMIGSTMCEGTDLSMVLRVVNLSEFEKRLPKGKLLSEAELVEIVEESRVESDEIQEIDTPQDYRLTTLQQKVLGNNTFERPSKSVDHADSGMDPQESTDEDTSYLLPILEGLQDNLSVSQKDQVRKFLFQNRDVFSKSEFDLGRTNLVKHSIDTGSNRPFRQQLRRHPIGHLDIIDEHVKKMLENDPIEPSNSPWASNVVLVRKQDGSLRFCIDYRQLNRLCTRDFYPLPRIDACFDALGKVKYLSTLDLRSGYWQVENDPDAAEKSSFITRSGLFKPKCLSFGLSNAPAVFQRLMDLVLSGLSWNICMVFLDDIIVMSSTFEEHLECLGLVLDRLRKANLILKPTKCHLFQRKVKFLLFPPKE